MRRDHPISVGGDMLPSIQRNVDALLNEFGDVVESLSLQKNLRKAQVRSLLQCTYVVLLDASTLYVVAQHHLGTPSATYLHRPQVDLSKEQVLDIVKSEFGLTEHFMITFPASSLEATNEQRRETLDKIALEHVEEESKRIVWISEKSVSVEGEAYDVVLSFAGEDREYVEAVAEYLKQSNVRVFYDGYEEVSLWGKELTEYFDRVFRGPARYCVMFISKYYASKVWTNLERRSALAKQLQEKEEYILPARFDDTELPGLRPTIGYVDLRKKSPQALCEMILQKLGRLKLQRGAPTNFKGPIKSEEKSELKKRQKKRFASAEEKWTETCLSFDRGDYSSAMNNLNTALELRLKELLEIPLTVSKINTANIIEIWVSNDYRHSLFLSEAKKHVLDIDNKIKHARYVPSRKECIDGMKSIEDVFKKLKGLRLTDDMKNRLHEGLKVK